MPLLRIKDTKRNKRIILLMIVLLIAAFASSIIASGIMFKRSTRENRERIISKTAKLAVEQVDGDKIDHWLGNGTDEQYDKTASLLQSICNKHALCPVYLRL